MSDETRKALGRAAKQFDRWRAEREELILQAHGEGASLREIAGEIGLTHVAVMKIVNKFDVFKVPHHGSNVPSEPPPEPRPCQQPHDPTHLDPMTLEEARAEVVARPGFACACLGGLQCCMVRRTLAERVLARGNAKKPPASPVKD